MGEMDANLMGPARLNGNGEKGKPASKIFNDPPVCYGLFPPGVGDGHLFPLDWMAGYGQVNCALFLIQQAVHQCAVFLLDLPGLELQTQCRMGLVILRHHQEARGILIQSMDDPRPRDSTDGRKGSAVPQESMDQRPGMMSGRRMDHQAGGLVHHDHRIVFMNNFEIDGFRVNH